MVITIMSITTTPMSCRRLYYIALTKIFNIRDVNTFQRNIWFISTFMASVSDNTICNCYSKV